jgi:hypothetical protein
VIVLAFCVGEILVDEVCGERKQQPLCHFDRIALDGGDDGVVLVGMDLADGIDAGNGTTRLAPLQNGVATAAKHACTSGSAKSFGRRKNDEADWKSAVSIATTPASGSGCSKICMLD